MWGDILSECNYRLNNQTTSLDIQLWLLVLISMSGDILLTIIGLEMGFVELNPIIVFGMETFGYVVLAYLKVPAILIGLIAWLSLPIAKRQLILVGLALPWIAASLFNAWIILSAYFS